MNRSQQLPSCSACVPQSVQLSPLEMKVSTGFVPQMLILTHIETLTKAGVCTEIHTANSKESVQRDEWGEQSVSFCDKFLSETRVMVAKKNPFSWFLHKPVQIFSNCCVLPQTNNITQCQCTSTGEAHGPGQTGPMWDTRCKEVNWVPISWCFGRIMNQTYHSVISMSFVCFGWIAIKTAAFSSFSVTGM